MNWKQEIIGMLVMTVQMIIIFISWWYEVLAIENSEIYVSITILITGIVGGLFINKKKYTGYNEKPSTYIILIIMFSLVSTIGLFFIIIPLIDILKHSSSSTIMIVIGALSPWLIPKIHNKVQQFKNA